MAYTLSVAEPRPRWFLLTEDVISKDLCRRTANAIYSFVQANREEPETW